MASTTQSPAKATKPGRLSRFIEASMDSKKSIHAPPSIFMRNPGEYKSNHDGLHYEALLDAYTQDANSPPSGKNRNSQISASTTETAKKQKGFFRSIATALNPFSIFSRAYTEAAEEIVKEETEQLEEAAVVEDKQPNGAITHITTARVGIPANGTPHTKSEPALRTAEQALQELKDLGLLPTPKVFVRPNTAARPKTATTPRKSSDTVKFTPPNTLRKSGSRKVLRKTSQATISTPPTTLRKSVSKKDLRHQRKLSKRVSDLETKLLEARRELSLALGDDAPPVPPLPPFLSGITIPNGRFTPSSQISLFVPTPLPSTPSESLLHLPEPPSVNKRKLEEDDTVYKPKKKVLERKVKAKKSLRKVLSFWRLK